MKNESFVKTIESQSESLFSWVREIREHIHQNPELSFKEYNTSAFILKKLQEIGLEEIHSIAKTGIVALISNPNINTSECIALRADIDALPILEQNSISYKSRVDGIMHACGHDVHTAILLGAARIIFQNREKLKYSVKLIFQPGEEVHPGGASILIKEGVLKNPSVKKIYGLHVYPELDSGLIGMKPDMYMASSDELYVEIEGKGGHGALPERCINPIEIGAEIVLNSRAFIDQLNVKNIPTVLSFGYFQAEGSTNVIPPTSSIKGTFRTFNEEWREEALRELADFIEKIGKRYKAKATLKRSKGYPCLVNDIEVTNELKDELQSLLGDSSVVDLNIRMTAEDFAFYAQEVPACFFRLGVRNEEKGITHSVHHPLFNIDDQSLKTGVKIMSLIPFL